jgi:anti-sigma B factor antagonist
MPSPPVFSLTVERLGDACVARPVGELDMASVHRVRAPLEAGRAEGRTTLLDMSRVSFIDSSGLHLLLDMAQSVERYEWAFFVVRPSAPVRRLIELTRTAARLPIVLTDAAADEPATAAVPAHVA